MTNKSRFRTLPATDRVRLTAVAHLLVDPMVTDMAAVTMTATDVVTDPALPAEIGTDVTVVTDTTAETETVATAVAVIATATGMMTVPHYHHPQTLVLPETGTMLKRCLLRATFLLPTPLPITILGRNNYLSDC
jgi:hypothetical protein